MKLARTKTEQSTEKENKNKGSKLFFGDLVLRGHKQELYQLCLIIYPLFITLSHNLHQLNFLPPPSPQTEYATPLVGEGMLNNMTALPPDLQKSLYKNDDLTLHCRTL